MDVDAFRNQVDPNTPIVPLPEQLTRPVPGWVVETKRLTALLPDFRSLLHFVKRLV